jgi:hypothetical protein
MIRLFHVPLENRPSQVTRGNSDYDPPVRRLPYFVVVLPALCCQPSPVVVAPSTSAQYAPPTPPSPPGATPSATPEPRPPTGPATEVPEEPARPPPSCPSGMVPILGGTAHLTGEHVTVADFCLDRTEVTAGQYRSCAASHACSDAGLLCDSAATYATPTKLSHPINCIDAVQAASFCRAHGKRLPTAEEWWPLCSSSSEGTSRPWSPTRRQDDQRRATRRSRRPRHPKHPGASLSPPRGAPRGRRVEPTLATDGHPRRPKKEHEW